MRGENALTHRGELLEPESSSREYEWIMSDFVASPAGYVLRRRRPRWLSSLAVLSAVVVGSTLIGLVPTGTAAADTAPPVREGSTEPAVPETVSTDALPTPQVNGVVWDQVVVGDTVYVAGSFTSARPFGAKAGVNESARGNFLAYDLHTGTLLPYAPMFDTQVRALDVSPDGKRLYVGGAFSSVNGQPRYRLAAFDLPSGALSTTFKPYANAAVYAIDSSPTALYVGGNVTVLSRDSGTPGVARHRVGAVSATDGTVLPWAPVLSDGWVNSLLVSPSNDKIVLGGTFRAVNGSSDPGYAMAAVDPTSGNKMLPWAINSVVPNRTYMKGIEKDWDVSVYSLASDGTYVYGTMGPIGFEGTFKARWSDGSFGEDGWVADCHGDSYSVAPVGEVVYTASHAHDCGNLNSFEEYTPPDKWYRALAFTTAKTQVTRAEDAHYWKDYEGFAAPSVLHWYPTFDIGPKTGQGPWDVTAAQGYVLYGGEFSQVNRAGQQGLARFGTSAKAMNKQGPQLENAAMTPTVGVFDGVNAMLSWSANYDRDNETLTYQVIRDGDTKKPVFETAVDSSFWKRPVIRAVDPGLTPGKTYSYRIRTIDPLGNVRWGDAATATATTPAAPGTSGTLSAYDLGVLRDQPTSYWPMNEASGHPLGYDWAGGNSLSTLTSRTPGIDASGSAASMDGKAQHAASTNAAHATPRFSSELWFKTTSRSGGLLMGFSTSRTSGSNANGAPTDAFDRQLYLDDAGRVNFEVFTGIMFTASSSASYNDGGWHHVVATGDLDRIELFVDGSSVSSKAIEGDPWLFDGYWGIGGHDLFQRVNRPTSNHLAASIDNVATYDRVLSPKSIAAHYAAAPQARPNASPVASFTAGATGLAASFDGSGSTDPDGSIAGYAWTFGDGSSGTGAKASHTFAKAGTYTVRLTVTDDAGAKASVSKSVTVTAPPAGPRTVAADGFARSVSSSWGSAVTGGAWKLSGGNSGFSVAQPAGKITSTAGQTRAAVLSSVASASSDSTVSFMFDVAPTGGGQYAWVVGRQVGSETYLARVWAQANGKLQLQLMRGGTVLKALNLPGSYVAGEVVKLRLQVSGSGTSTLNATAWTSGAEPAAWQLSATDTTAALQQPGAVGLGSYVSASATTPTTVSFTGYIVTTV